MLGSTIPKKPNVIHWVVKYYNLSSWIIMDHHGSSWNIMERHGSSWICGTEGNHGCLISTLEMDEVRSSVMMRAITYFQKWLFCNLLHGNCEKMHNKGFSRRFLGSTGPVHNSVEETHAQHLQAMLTGNDLNVPKQKHQHALHLVSKCRLSHFFANLPIRSDQDFGASLHIGN